MNEIVEMSKQQAKSARARAAICEATIDCLVKHGYSETSLNRVAALAGFSKGALQHHFPCKEDLMVATADRLLERPVTKKLKSEERPKTVEAALLLNWNKYTNTEAYRALLEILIATRTDQKLQDRISDKLKAWNKIMDQQSVEVFQSRSGDDEDVAILLTMSRSLMRGLVIQDTYSTDPEENLKYVHRWIDLVAPLLELKKNAKT